MAALAIALSLGPAIAQAEPSGGAYEFAREIVSTPGLASAENGRVLSSWFSTDEGAARVLGRSGPLTPRIALGASDHGDVVAANSGTGRYLRVWAEATPWAGCWACSTFRLYSQGLDRDGTRLGAPSLVLSRGVEGTMSPVALAWNSKRRQFLLLYSIGDEGYSETGTILLTEAGAAVTDGRTVIPAPMGLEAAIAARPKDGTYLATWREDGLIRGRILTASGKLGSSPAFDVTRHSNLAGRVDNREPAVAVDPATNESIVVWSDRYEVFARRITAAGAVAGSDLWLSRMGPSWDPDWLTRSPDVAYSHGAQQYLVVWQSGPGEEPYPAGEFVYGQHLSRTGGQIGTNDFKISTLDRAVEPAVTAFHGSTDFLTAWSSRRSSPSAWARRVTRTP